MQEACMIIGARATDHPEESNAYGALLGICSGHYDLEVIQGDHP
jgi:hypothetical protein